MKVVYPSRAIRVPWTSVGSLPTVPIAVRILPPARDAAVEGQFALPRRQLASARGIGRLLLEATADGTGPSLGLAVLAPAFPGAFPFRVVDSHVIRPLLEAMHAHVPESTHVNLVVDDDERVVKLLVDAGAEVRGEFLHLVGAL
jgi:hypothetical protein